MRSKQWYTKTSQAPKSLVNSSTGCLPSISSSTNKIIGPAAGGCNRACRVVQQGRNRRCRSLGCGLPAGTMLSERDLIGTIADRSLPPDTHRGVFLPNFKYIWLGVGVAVRVVVRNDVLRRRGHHDHVAVGHDGRGWVLRKRTLI